MAISIFGITQKHTKQKQSLALLVCTILFSTCALAALEDQSAESRDDSDGLVEVQYSANILAPFKERKSNFSMTFGLGMEQVFPDAFVSKIDGNKYETLFGTSTLDILQGRLGMKYNTSAGGFEAGILAGYGEISDGRISYVTQTDTDSNLEVTKLGAYGSYIMDSLFSEPYIAPYLEGQLYTYDWLESAKSGEEEKGSTEFSYGFSLGVLFQLNWLDPSSAFVARESWGLNNTYIDLFVSYYSPGGGSDPDFSSNTNYGFGLKLEF